MKRLALLPLLLACACAAPQFNDVPPGSKLESEAAYFAGSLSFDEDRLGRTIWFMRQGTGLGQLTPRGETFLIRVRPGTYVFKFVGDFTPKEGEFVARATAGKVVYVGSFTNKSYWPAPPSIIVRDEFERVSEALVERYGKLPMVRGLLHPKGEPAKPVLVIPMEWEQGED